EGRRLQEMARPLVSKVGFGDPVKLRVGLLDQAILGRPVSRSESMQKRRDLAWLRHLARRRRSLARRQDPDSVSRFGALVRLRTGRNPQIPGGSMAHRWLGVAVWTAAALLIV